MAFIGDFLEKFKKIHGERLSKKQSVLQAVNMCLGIELTETDIVIKDRTLSIKASASLKTEIYMKKEALLAAVLPFGVDTIKYY